MRTKAKKTKATIKGDSAATPPATDTAVSGSGEDSVPESKSAEDKRDGGRAAVAAEDALQSPLSHSGGSELGGDPTY